MELVVKINGGLGNQLFQYAMGRALASRSGAELFLDLDFFRIPGGAHTPRRFELDRFEARYEEASPQRILPYHALRASGWKRRAARIIPFAFRRQILTERRMFRYDPSSTRIDKDTYLEGYWQSERYFADQAQSLRADLRFKEEPGPQDREVLCGMEGGVPVSLHVRRGDYVTHAGASAVHGTCSPEYYTRAMRRIAEQEPRAVFHVFSDDPRWARAHLPASMPLVFVDHNRGVSDHMDLMLMAACHHHIIANSSFSWWGAWLNPREAKTVIAPRHWFRDPAVETTDLIPTRWIRL